MYNFDHLKVLAFSQIKQCYEDVALVGRGGGARDESCRPKFLHFHAVLDKNG